MQLKPLLVLAGAASANPLAKIIGILSDIEQKIIKEGEEAQKVFDEFSEWCEDRSRNVGFEIKTGKSQVAELTATIQNEESKQDSLTTEIEELGASIASNDKDLQAATTVRNAEKADFEVEEKELNDIIDTLNRAIALIEKEMAKGSASMVQLKSARNLAQAFQAMVQASVFDSADEARLSSFMQSNAEGQDMVADAETEDMSDRMMGAPAAAAYESKSGGIVDTLQGLLDKAEEQLDNAVKKETSAANNYALLKQALEDEIKFATKEKDAATKGLSTSDEAEAVAKGDLTVTKKDLADDIDTLGSLHHDCLTGAEDFQAETKSRSEELKALSVAKSALKDAAAAAASFLQTDTVTHSHSAPTAEVIHYLRKLAKEQNSASLAQLAGRIASVERLTAGTGQDPFAKIKTLISDMVEKLEKDSAADATQKAYCDKELKEANAKRHEKTAEVDHLSTKIDSKTTASAKLKEEVAKLQSELAQLSRSMAEADKIRAEENADFKVNKADVEQGLEGVKMALKVMRDYYSKKEGETSQGGAAGGVIGMLEVVESDFSKGLAELVAVEDQSAREYYIQSNENKVTKKIKEQDVKYKTKEATSLDKAVTEHTTDREGAQSELDAVLEYLKKLDDMCVAKAETYSERAGRRKAEIDGLREALSILESETAFVQKTALRGVRPHA
jgi:chromosome segregation ATPase